jgi:hypothetical protein
MGDWGSPLPPIPSINLDRFIALDLILEADVSTEQYPKRAESLAEELLIPCRD